MISPSLRVALFLLSPLFKVDLTATTSILLTEEAPTVPAPSTPTPETCPGALYPKISTSNPLYHSVEELL